MRPFDPRQVLDENVEIFKESLGEVLLLLELFPEEEGVHRLHDGYDLVDEVLNLQMLYLYLRHLNAELIGSVRFHQIPAVLGDDGQDEALHEDDEMHD